MQLNIPFKIYRWILRKVFGISRSQIFQRQLDSQINAFLNSKDSSNAVNAVALESSGGGGAAYCFSYFLSSKNPHTPLHTLLAFHAISQARQNRFVALTRGIPQ